MRGGTPGKQCCHLGVSPQIDYPEIADGIMPRHRFMSAYEQRIEPPDRRWQYLLMAAEPYETIAFKVACAAHSRGPCFWDGKGHPEVVLHQEWIPCVSISDMPLCRASQGFLDYPVP